MSSQTTYDGLDDAELARLTRAPRAVVLDRVPSVMDVSHDLGEHGAASGTIVLANEQTAGRGRAGRTWHSPPGSGIWLAVLLRPAQPPVGGALAIRVGLAVHDALAASARRLTPSLKWPNDITQGGRKLGGILCEARWTGESPSWVTVGVGLNVHGPIAAEVADIALAISDVDPDVSRLGILRELVPRVSALEGGPLSQVERDRYLRCLFMPPGPDVPTGIEPDGALLVRTPEGRLERRTEAG